MALDLVDSPAEQLGYLDSTGFVSGRRGERGARDYVWQDLREKCGVDAAYFRGAVPLVAFAGVEARSDIVATQRRLWNFGRVPLLIAASSTEVAAVNCTASPAATADGGGIVLRSVRPDQPLGSVLAEFTRFGLETGRAAAEHGSRFDRRQRVDALLLGNLHSLRSRLARRGLADDVIERLLGCSIFVRYLEDSGILSGDHLAELGLPDSFSDALRAGRPAVLQLFEALAEQFNGDVFASAASDASLSNEALADLETFFSGSDVASGQRALWPYDFGIIPPELISSIYEQLLKSSQQSDAAYYTPRSVVDLVLDELIPWDATGWPTVLDPACGSGIFLTEAFRRLRYRAESRDQQASFDSLSHLLTTSIFGVDKNPAAVGVAAFGLSLALLERVDPPTAWRTARLPRLVSENLIASEFFDDHPINARGFDLVVGNPPWRSRLSPGAKEFLRRRDIKAPDKQMAHAFLWRADEMLNDDGALGLVLPAKSFLHNRTGPAIAARQRVFAKLEVDTIVDLSPVRRVLFASAASPACVLIARSGRSDRKRPLVHASPRRTSLSTAIEGLVVSQQNIREIPPGLARSSALLWKTHLWGGPLDFEFVRHLQETIPSLGDLAGSRGWVSGQGYQVGGGGRNDATAILGWPRLQPDAIGPLTVDAELRDVVTHRVMHRPRDPGIYKAPHIVVRKGFSRAPVAAYVEFDAAFTDDLFGVAGPRRDADDLRVVAGVLNSSLARYWFFMTSSSWGVEREQILPNEIRSLPIQTIEGSRRRDILEAVSAAGRGGSEWQEPLDEAVFAAYDLRAAEIDLIRDGLELHLDEHRQGPLSVAYRTATAQQLDEYTRTLESDLREGQSIDWAVEVADRKLGYVAVACHADPDNRSDRLGLEQFLQTGELAAPEWESPTVIVEPTVIVLDESSVRLIKPDERRYWSSSAARSDARDVTSAIVRDAREATSAIVRDAAGAD